MNWIEVNGASLRYELCGAGPATIVLIHELGGVLESWDEVLPSLTQRSRVLRYDQRGCGLSEKARGTMTLDTQVTDLLGLLDALGIDRPCRLVGSALGAGIALAFAARHPERVERVLASCPATDLTPDRAALLEHRARGVERDGMRPYAESSLNNSYPEVLRRLNRNRFERYRLRWIANDPFGFAAMNRMLGNMQLGAQYARIRCPVLVLAGRHDGMRGADVVKPIADAIRDSQYLEIDSGHFMAVQTPDVFLEYALPFLCGE